MSAKYYCDGCGKQLKKHEHERLIVTLGRIKVEVMHCLDKTWNKGNVCWHCIRETVAKGKP